MEKGYLYYHGEEVCPYDGNPYAGFWRIERYHKSLSDDNNEEWYKHLIELFKSDFPKLKVWGEEYSDLHREVVVLILQSMFEGGYYGEDIEKEISYYGTDSTTT